MNATQRTRTLFSGSFSESRPMRVVIWSVLKEKKVNFAVLKISAPDHGIEGEIGVMWGLFFTGACLLGRRERGYEAIKVLLSLPAGKFEYADYGEIEPLALNEGLKIRLTDLVSLWPDLPATMEQLTCRTSLNRMRKMSLDPSCNNEVKVMIDQNVLKQLEEFDQKTMHLRAVAFWGAAIFFSSIATMIGILQH